MFQAEIDGTVSDTRNIVTASSQESVNHQFHPEIFIINLYHRLKSCCRGYVSNPNTFSLSLSLLNPLPLQIPYRSAKQHLSPVPVQQK